MSWARLDDRANEHRKQLLAGPEACWMWSCGLMYANRQDARDGFIPEPMLAMLYPFTKPKKLAAKLVEVGLWEVVPGGYLIHGYHDWNPTREQVEAERAKGRERAAASYQKRKPKPADSSPEESGRSSPEDETKKRVSSGVEWSGEGSSSGSPEGEAGEDRETTCPPGLVETLTGLGVVAELAKAYGVPGSAVLAALGEFGSYWTLGAGSGKRRRNWPARARERVREKHREGKLAGMAVETVDRAANAAKVEAEFQALRAREKRERGLDASRPVEADQNAVAAVLAQARAQSVRGGGQA